MALRVGVVGAGRTGMRRARRLHGIEDVRITAVADPARTVRDIFVRAFGVGLAVHDHKRLVNDPHVDVVCVCSPPATRSAVAIDALHSGKHVICEHPMAVTIDQADEMMEAAEESGRRLIVALSRRYDPVIQEVGRLIDEDEIGYPFLTLLSLVGNEFDRLNDWHDWVGTWEMGGGGALMYYGSEVVDILRYLLGPVEAVSALCTRFAINPLNKAEDSCALDLEFTHESIAEVAITGAARYSPWSDGSQGESLRMEIYGLEGSMLISPSEPRLTIVSRSGGRRSVETSQISTDLPTDPDEDMLNSIVNEVEPFVTLEDARDSLQVILAGYKASQMKRRVETFENL